jgi:hypothetical protein
VSLGYSLTVSYVLNSTAEREPFQNVLESLNSKILMKETGGRAAA